MKTIILLLSLISFNSWADEFYKCYSVQGIRSHEDVVMKISTGLLSNKIKAVELVTEIKARKIEVAANPFTNRDASYYDVSQEAVSEASELNFKAISKDDGKSNSQISLSESILRFQASGYAYYHARSCFWILDCFTSTHYFKCDKI